MKELTEKEQQRYDEVYSATYNKYLSAPKEYFPHDSDAHKDDALRRLVLEHGMAVYGRYWLLVELLTAKRGHIYDISDDRGMDILALDMGALEPITRDDLRAFIRLLAEADLIDGELLGEGKLTSDRVTRNVAGQAEMAASKAATSSIGGSRGRRT